jgi:hypothetical protein
MPRRVPRRVLAAVAVLASRHVVKTPRSSPDSLSQSFISSKYGVSQSRGILSSSPKLVRIADFGVLASIMLKADHAKSASHRMTPHAVLQVV